MAIAAIRDANASDFDAICALNDQAVQHTSPMDQARLTLLDALACFHKVCVVEDRVAAFLLAMRDGAAYDNANFRWFSSRYPHFIYVDRIVVSGAFRGQRLGPMLYETLFDFARQMGVSLVTCEYNLVPKNEASKRFHDKFGFTEQGVQWIGDGSKCVSMQVAKSEHIVS